MQPLIVCHSYHHNNTQKIAQVIAEVLDAKIATPQQTNPEELKQYDLIGVGSGIDSGKHYKVVLDFADMLPEVTSKKAFIFSTSAITGEEKIAKDHAALREKLQAKGYTIVGEFGCKGFNTNSFLRILRRNEQGQTQQRRPQKRRKVRVRTKTIQKIKATHASNKLNKQ